MKENRVLKIISCFLIPILIAIIGISIFYEFGKEYYDEETYFSSEEFAYDYMAGLNNCMQILIHTEDDTSQSIIERRSGSNL